MAKATLETVTLLVAEPITTWGVYGFKSQVMDWEAIKEAFWQWRAYVEDQEGEAVSPYDLAEGALSDLEMNLSASQVNAMVKTIAAIVYDSGTDFLTDDIKYQLANYDNLRMAEINYRFAMKDTSPKAFYIVLMELLGMINDQQFPSDSSNARRYSISVQVYEYEVAGTVAASTLTGTSGGQGLAGPTPPKSKADDMFV